MPLTAKMNERALKAQAQFNRDWLLKEKRERHILDQLSLEKALEALTPSKAENLIELGCGRGELLAELQKRGVSVFGIDISSKALALAKESFPELPTQKGWAPETELRSNSFDWVVAHDLIADLDPRDHRLFFSEMGRLCKPNGKIFFSTPVDIDSEDAIERLLQLAKSEMEIERVDFSCHHLFVRLDQLLKLPRKLLEAQKKPSLSEALLKSSRSKIGKALLRLSLKTSLPWSLLSKVCTPLQERLRGSRRVALFLEKLSRTVWDRQAISHLQLIGKKRPL